MIERTQLGRTSEATQLKVKSSMYSCEQWLSLSESSLRYLSGIWIIASVRGETQKRQHVRPASVYQHLILNGLAVAADEWSYETHEWKARLSYAVIGGQKLNGSAREAKHHSGAQL